MARNRSLLLLTLFALLLPAARRASATPPDARDDQATTVVEQQLVKPLAKSEGRRSRFSRGYIPPQERRVRILDSQRSTDSRGAAFVTFAVDEHSGTFARRATDNSGPWRRDAIVGCVYPARDEVFIKRGDKFFAAALLLGQKTSAADDTVCRPAPARTQEQAPVPQPAPPSAAAT